MLPPFIIEQIRKREDEELRKQEQPVAEIPAPGPESPEQDPHGGKEETERGVVIIDLAG